MISTNRKENNLPKFNLEINIDNKDNWDLVMYDIKSVLENMIGELNRGMYKGILQNSRNQVLGEWKYKK
jgi:hypothetical protein